jgi:hypothetical protein
LYFALRKTVREYGYATEVWEDGYQEAILKAILFLFPEAFTSCEEYLAIFKDLVYKYLDSPMKAKEALDKIIAQYPKSVVWWYRKKLTKETGTVPNTIMTQTRHALPKMHLPAPQ